DLFAGTTAGQLLRRSGGEWVGAGSVPSSIVSLTAVE
ncbi:glycosyl hydrolase, partial [Halobacteriales archaeon QH_10_70_21]